MDTGKKTKQINGAIDYPRKMLLIKEAPDSLIALRQLLALPENKDIYDAANKETTFEVVLATVAEKLDIVLDGTYDVGPLCTVLAEAMKRRHMGPGLRFDVPGLQRADIVERESSVTLEPVKNEAEGEAVNTTSAPHSEGPPPKLVLQ
jgi:hypothetical protein